MEFYGASNDDYDHEIIYDFNNELPLVQIIGLHAIIKNPKIYFILNLLFIISVGILHLFLMSMSIITISLESIERMTRILNLLFLSFLACAFCIPSIKFTHLDQLDKVMRLLKEGIYNYSDDWEDDEIITIRKRRVAEIRFISFAATILFNLTPFLTPLHSTLNRYFLQEESEQDSFINPYIPLPMYMPFDTYLVPYFVIAFLSESLFYVVFYNSVVAYVSSYLGIALQLVAQIEILNYSLENLERRALSKFIMEDGKRDLESCLCFCLRENVQHHQAILRFTKEIKTYLEPINTMIFAAISVIFALSIVPVLENPTRNSYMLLMAAGETLGYYQLSWLGQLVIDKSSDTYSALYSTPWYKCSKKFRSVLNIMQSNTREPLILRSRWIKTTASLETFSDMMIIAYKLVNVLLKQS